jgi:hypothetical protein
MENPRKRKKFIPAQEGEERSENTKYVSYQESSEEDPENLHPTRNARIGQFWNLGF